jgi:transcriptional regulator with XRE-family HTH domain
MDLEARKRLEADGHHVVPDVAEWLGLSQSESDFIDIRLDLRRLVRFARERAGLTQAQAARKLRSSQSRVSKMEAGDPSVSLDLLVGSALALGASRQEVATAVAGPATTVVQAASAGGTPQVPLSAEIKPRRSRSVKAA